MFAADAAFLDALASCFGAGVPLADALARVEPAGPEASRWVARIRPLLREDRSPSSIPEVLHAARVIDATERAVLAQAVLPAEVEGTLHALSLRRRRRALRRRSILRGLIGPFAIAVLTIVLDPLPNLLGSGSYVAPVLQGLFELTLLTAFALFGAPALLRSPTLAPRVLAFCARVPGLAWLCAREAEAELVTLSAPFAARSDGGGEGLLAAGASVAWSPLGAAVRGACIGATGGGRLPGEARLDWALLRLAPYLSLATNLAIVSGIAEGRLPAQLTACGQEIATRLTSHLRLGVRIFAYALVVILSLESMVGMISRALPGGALLPGGAPSAEQKELEEIMRELQGSPPAKHEPPP